jgi:hypothetical protein
VGGRLLGGKPLGMVKILELGKHLLRIIWLSLLHLKIFLL